jgi:hypothetical protein
MQVAPSVFLCVPDKHKGDIGTGRTRAFQEWVAARGTMINNSGLFFMARFAPIQIMRISSALI